MKSNGLFIYLFLLFTKQPGTVSGMDYGLERLVDPNQEEVKRYVIIRVAFVTKHILCIVLRLNILLKKVDAYNLSRTLLVYQLICKRI